MKEFIIDDSFFDIFPTAKIGIIVCKNINNTTNNKSEYEEMLKLAEEESKKHCLKDEFSENEVIRSWRDAFSKFPTKKGTRSSIESLLKRVNSGNHLNTINPLVDIYNSISLKYGIPCGGEDIDQFVGNVLLTRAEGTESFIALGMDSEMPPYKDEIVYKDDYGVICRCFNWRESIRTMLGDSTTNAFMCMELIDLNKESDFNNALNELDELISSKLNGENKLYILDISNKKILID